MQTLIKIFHKLQVNLRFDKSAGPSQLLFTLIWCSRKGSHCSVEAKSLILWRDGRVFASFPQFFQAGFSFKMALFFGCNLKNKERYPMLRIRNNSL